MNKIRIIVPFYLILLIFSLSSLELGLQPTECLVDLPEGWDLFDTGKNGRISFRNPDRSIIFQVTAYPGDSYTDDREMMNRHLDDLEIQEVDTSRFLYQNQTVSLADCLFLSSGNLIHGWLLFLERDDYDYYLMVITSENFYEESFPWMLSCLDSFSPDEESRYLPGPVSAMFSAAESEKKVTNIDFRGNNIEFSYDPVKNEAVQLLIEREASLLSTYQDPDEFAAAWIRYYRMIYSCSQEDLGSLSSKLAEILEGKGDTEKSEIILSWLQDFKYGSSESFSDLLSPVSVLQKRMGDCDALALVYSIILHDLGIPCLLMASYTYSHSMAAVLIDRQGAGFEYQGQKYIVAELTKKVDIGLISQDMADLSKWVIIAMTDGEVNTLSLIE